MFKIGSIGAGNMGLAIIDGAVKSGIIFAKDVAVFDISNERIKLCEDKGYTVLSEEIEILKGCEIVLLAIKPQGYEDLLKKLSNEKNTPKNQIILTIAAGISTNYIQEFLGKESKIIRIMPNTPLMIGYGACAFSKNDNVSDEEFDNLINIFKNMGEIAVIPESQMNSIIITNGSVPAFAYYFMDSLATSAQNMGIDKDLALRLIAKTFIGSAEMILQSNKTPQELIDMVCSPNGTTIETIKLFDERNVRGIIDEGCIKCVKRADELGK